MPGAIQLHAHAGSGIVHGCFAGDLTLERVQEMLNALQDAAEGAHGNLILPRCPVGWKRTLLVWGRPRGDAWLMREVKAKLDPKGLFNPARFLCE